MTDTRAIQARAHNRYPIFLNVAAKNALVVGGGHVAMRKVITLLDYGARVCVVAKDITAVIADLADDGRIELHNRAYTEGDCAGCMLVFCATNDEGLNKQVFADAHAAGALCNVVDVPNLCDFYVPSVLTRGKLQIAVSTNGASPAAARELRHELEDVVDGHWEAYLDLLSQVRASMLADSHMSPTGRGAVLKRVATPRVRGFVFKRLSAGEGISAHELIEMIKRGMCSGDAA
ncbi:MAG: bifunctional precorrin-2 dehydrogenase/sirohydrochlorin ferrochelatase [Coriobacteriales bacterium]|jgi:precorrin-2 dehydrogenase/sirohydrochlorin ferrochelatase|nr:bifunctional precorrin-2 dehydrogenase/sirohydrochlorin ferrochelatase [Coriobacteriales bacterium]